MKVGQAFPSKYLSAADLDGMTRKVTIERYTVEVVGDGDDAKEKPILHFVGKKKTLALNKTNANLIVETLGSDEMDDWIGKEISLYPTKVDYKGERVDAIRIKADAPPPPAAADDEEIPF